MNRTFKVFLILVTIFSSLIVLGSIFGGFLAHAQSNNLCGDSVTGLDYIGCQLQVGFSIERQHIQLLEHQNSQLIQLQEQTNKLLALQFCHQTENPNDWCVSQVLNETK